MKERFCIYLVVFLIIISGFLEYQRLEGQIQIIEEANTILIRVIAEKHDIERFKEYWRLLSYQRYSIKPFTMYFSDCNADTYWIVDDEDYILTTSPITIIIK